MSRPMFALALSALALLAAARPAAAGPLTTSLQSASIPMSRTDWGPGSSGMQDPLVFQQFNPGLGTLDGVAVTLNATFNADFSMTFVPTPITTTIYLATTSTTDPTILSNPSLVAQLTDGPTITLSGPGGLSTIFGGPGTTMPVDVVSLTEPSGTYSSTLPVTDPNYIAPDNATFSLSRTLDGSDGSLFSSFIGTGTVGLPISAVAYASFYSSSGNGSGMVIETAGATVTVQYLYTPPPVTTSVVVPEPSGCLLLGIGAALGLIAARRRRAGTRRPRPLARPAH